jgi:hypothetical protein
VNSPNCENFTICNLRNNPLLPREVVVNLRRNRWDGVLSDWDEFMFEHFPNPRDQEELIKQSGRIRQDYFKILSDPLIRNWIQANTPGDQDVDHAFQDASFQVFKELDKRRSVVEGKIAHLSPEERVRFGTIPEEKMKRKQEEADQRAKGEKVEFKPKDPMEWLYEEKFRIDRAVLALELLNLDPKAKTFGSFSLESYKTWTEFGIPSIRKLFVLLCKACRDVELKKQLNGRNLLLEFFSTQPKGGIPPFTLLKNYIEANNELRVRYSKIASCFSIAEALTQHPDLTIDLMDPLFFKQENALYDPKTITAGHTYNQGILSLRKGMERIRQRYDEFQGQEDLMPMIEALFGINRGHNKDDFFTLSKADEVRCPQGALYDLLANLGLALSVDGLSHDIVQCGQ